MDQKECRRCGGLLIGFEAMGDTCNDCLAAGFNSMTDDEYDDYMERQAQKELKMSGMKAGTETGSLVNYMLSHQDQAFGETVKVGDGATILGWSDRHPATVIEVKGGKRKTIVIQHDRAIRTDRNGMSEMQSYTYERDPNGEIEEVGFRNGAWRVRGTDNGVRFGSREKYYDFSF